MHAQHFPHQGGRPDVCIMGMGYVGLTLAVALAEAGWSVLGYEVRHDVCEALNQSQPHFREHGVPEALRRHLGRSLTITNTFPAELPPAVVICVSTPVDGMTHEPDLRQLGAAVTLVAEQMSDDTLVIVRSTVPVGTCRSFVLPILQEKVEQPLLAFCPERTIQGKALEELMTLPQIIGGASEAAAIRARKLFEPLVSQMINVSSLEAAEMVKLVCNAHTDLIYGFGNEVALMANVLGVDAYEVINAANLNYPRPDLSRPGFVGGSCLVKDPYLLIHSVQPHGYFPPMVAAARTLNESVPQKVGENVVAGLQALGRDVATCKIFISGFAYKGQPETDDLRGSAVEPILTYLRSFTPHITGHDFIVSPDRIAALGVEPVSLEQGFQEADAVLILNNHLNYQSQNIEQLVMRMKQPSVFFDVWGVFRKQLQTWPNLRYMRLSWMNES